MRLKIKISDSNRGVEVRDARTGELLDGVIGVQFDSTMSSIAKVTVEIMMPCVDIEFVPDELIRKGGGFHHGDTENTEKGKELG